MKLLPLSADFWPRRSAKVFAQTPSVATPTDKANKNTSESLGATFRKLPPVNTPERANFAELRPHLSYLSSKQIRQIKEAFIFARTAHDGQTRKDGTPYITHPVAACQILADMHLDSATLMATLLHDVIEDCGVSQEDIAQRFGDKVAHIVAGVTKLEHLYKSDLPIDVASAQAENFQKMLLAMANDLRVILVKLADRLHNMRTLDAMSVTAKKRIARETLEIYAPIANRMGLDAIFRELQSLSFRYLYPMRAQAIEAALSSEYQRRETSLARLTHEVMASLKQAGIRAEISSRLKNAYSIYCKMVSRHAKFDKVFDVCGIRIVLEKREQCYAAIGVLHGLYKPVPGRFKDFIALPKSNGYQSLHTTVIGPGGVPVEIQIRSKVMNWVAESGLAAHWLYKDKTKDLSDLEMRANQWINSLLELSQTSASAGELLEHVKTDLFNDSVYIFTPKGKIINLPRGSTALDLAYSIHTDIGLHAKTAHINGAECSLRTELKTGDRVSITVSPMPTVTVASIAYTKTARARSQIRHYLRHLEQEGLRDLGEHWLRQTLLDISLLSEADWSALSLPDLEKRLVSAGICGVGQIKKLLTDIALGSVSPISLAKALLKRGGSLADDKDEGSAKLGGALLGQTDKLQLYSANMPMVHYAACCFPIPDDAIEGIIKRGEGMIVHRADCKELEPLRRKPQNMAKEPLVRRLPLTWANTVDGQFISRMTVMVMNSQGALATISSVIAEGGCNIVGIQMPTTHEAITPISIDIWVDNRITLGRLYKRLHALSTVKSIVRWRK